MDRLAELKAQPIFGFLYAQTEEDADTDAGLIEQLGKSAKATRPELASLFGSAPTRSTP